ncbi:uncharacterized protein L3040_004224 [Drepanopeziza brunnea f. sp. 'multigermtubi']|uniref:uncharacterized protein n=1 Tax=Drepanopeziza brunnea f. sp. 'multigermtubi' TaxID=698441 RepID=UPI0023967AB8|nr:hypothetical protein L3040_004224 [Drepanopeziza brunnea f. sp. 'multigermtubi']
MQLSIPLLLVLAGTGNACVKFKGVFPFAETAPFEASITENGVTTCWISTTYAEHAAAQEASRPLRISKRSSHRKISLSTMPALSADSRPAYFSSPYTSPQTPASSGEEEVDLSAVPPPRGGRVPETQKYPEEAWEDWTVWQPWNFECIPGYKARANVGLRSFVYVVHGQQYFFVPDLREDVAGEKWEYSSRLWCGESDKRGKLVAMPKPKPNGGKAEGEQAKGGKAEGEQAKGGKAGGAKTEEKKKQEGVAAVLNKVAANREGTGAGVKSAGGGDVGKTSVSVAAGDVDGKATSGRASAAGGGSKRPVAVAKAGDAKGPRTAQKSSQAIGQDSGQAVGKGPAPSRSGEVKSSVALNDDGKGSTVQGQRNPAKYGL